MPKDGQPRKPWVDRGSRHERGYGAAWVKLRQVILTRDAHLCQPCLRQDRPTPATQVDHIAPKAKGGTDEPHNLQAICDACHEAKSKVDAGAKPRLAFDAQGYPIWPDR